MHVLNKVLVYKEEGFDFNVPEEERISEARSIAENEYGVKVCADYIADCISQFHERFGVVYNKTGVHFKCDFCNTVRLCELGGFFPVGDDLLVPLPVEYLAEIVRPRAGDPVRIF